MNFFESYSRLEAPVVLGMISGTSADGIDTAVVRFGRDSFELLDHNTAPFPSGVRERLFDLFEDRATVREVARIDVELGRIFAEVAAPLCRRFKVVLIASHGQTVCHLPEDSTTMQLGQPAVIAKTTGVATVADFRHDDMALGGQGAPLVPYFDGWLLRDPKVARAALNIGGIANLTFIPPQGEISGCDTGPGNSLSDALVELHCGETYDAGGRLAAQGQVQEELLQELLSHPYFQETGPKSTGREIFGRPMARALWHRGKPFDLIRTALALTAESIAMHLRQWGQNPCEVVAAGGGCDNPVLWQELEQRMPQGFRLRRFEDFGVPASCREAVAFALLGHRSARGETASEPGATGARRAAVLGKFVLP